MIRGDFSFDLLKTDNIIYYFYSLIYSLGYYTKIIFPTHFHRFLARLVDDTFCRMSPFVFETLSGIMVKCFSVYQPHYSIFNELSYLVYYYPNDNLESLMKVICDTQNTIAPKITVPFQ